MSDSGKCPVAHGALTKGEDSNLDWWPKSLIIDILHQNDNKTNPLGKDLNYNIAAWTKVMNADPF